MEKVSELRRRKGLEDQPLNGHTPDTLEIIIGSFPEDVNYPLRDQSILIINATTLFCFYRGKLFVYL